jgi:nitrite reductase (NO-forming)
MSRWLLPCGVLVLLAGLWGGLSRLGYHLSAATTSAQTHGVLMSLGFLGTLIAIERATALGKLWAWFVPVAAVAGSAWVVGGQAPEVGRVLLLCAGAGLVAVYVALDRIQRSTHNALMGVAAIGWVVAAALWSSGRTIGSTVPWLAVFLVVTITAERLELSRLLGTSKLARTLLVNAVLFMVVGATISIWQPHVGIRVCGVAMVALAAWLGQFDLARRTVRQTGVTRFMAVGLLCGYCWLAIGGALWATGGYRPANGVYDAQLHAIFLGFVISMVMAHAPVIAPAVLRRPLPYSPAFYGPLALLHAGLTLRIVGGDTAGLTSLWQLGGVLNEVALLAFIAVTAGAMLRARMAKCPTRTTETPTRRISTPTAAGAALGVVVLAIGIVFANSGGNGTPTNTSQTVDAAAATTGVAISLVEMRIEPKVLTVAPGSHLILRVTNNGTMEHDLRLSNGAHTKILSPGETTAFDAGTITKPLTGWCTLPGHRQAGMTMTILLGSNLSTAGSESAGPSPSDSMGGMSGMGDMTSAPPSGPDAVSIDLAATPPPGWTPIDARLAAAPPATVHDVTWHIKDVTMTVAPGVTQTMWTFNGTVPGPVLHGHVGDTFNVTVVNDTAMTHNIDFHAESGPPATVMTPIAAGATHTYHFVASHAGAWLYHCGVEPMLMHMGNGMYGALIIDPPNLRPAATQYVLVGSEMFFGPQGQTGDYSKMLADKPDDVVFNGYPFAYQHSPLQAKAGELVRVWIVDAGPSRNIDFHVVGAPFSTTYLDGAYLLDDGGAAGGAQTLPVDPGDGGFVELTFNQPGKYPFLTHAMADAVIGATGSFDVKP